MSDQGVDMRELLPQERRELLETTVVNLFRSALFLAEDDEFPLDRGFFDLGLTSLRLSDIKQDIEAEFGCEIDTTVLFSRPTAEQLINYLADEVWTV
ncbi:acyl carrier protein [Streptomyces bobili]|uniref:acyl carrier protein n=1 Tax=Streptomyces bobili TaxID=67280 RepID=UPI0033D2FBBC